MNVFTAIALLNKIANGAGDVIKKLLADTIASSPDLAATLQPILDELNADITPQSVAALVAVLPAEVVDLLKLHFEARTHPGDSA